MSEINLPFVFKPQEIDLQKTHAPVFQVFGYLGHALGALGYVWSRLFQRLRAEVCLRANRPSELLAFPLLPTSLQQSPKVFGLLPVNWVPQWCPFTLFRLPVGTLILSALLEDLGKGPSTFLLIVV